MEWAVVDATVERRTPRLNFPSTPLLAVHMIYCVNLLAAMMIDTSFLWLAQRDPEWRVVDEMLDVMVMIGST
jgi:hypothetical protein